MQADTPATPSDALRREAAFCNDQAWILIEKPQLNSEELARLLTLAGTARHLWEKIGNERNRAHADLLLSWSLARAEVSEAAFSVASGVLSYFSEHGQTWEQAFAHGAMAAASAACGKKETHEHHFMRARELGEALSGPDAKYFIAAFSTISTPDTPL